jgi:WD40 repeat protein
MAGSWVVPGGGTGSANFTNTGLGWDGSSLLIGDFTNSRIVKASTDGAYVGQIALSGAPASSVQGVAYDTSDGSYWVCHYAATSGTIRRYNSSGTLQQTISPGLGTSGPNGCAYDAANDRILAAFGDNVIRSYNCTTGALVETIAVSGHASGSGLDGITLDYTSPSTIIWGTFDGDSTGVIPSKPAYLYQINRSTGAATAGVVIPSSVEGVAFTSATDLYLCTDQFYHLGSANGNRVWKISKTTGDVQETTATQYASGSFTLNTSTGAQVIAGLGFSPKMVIFFGSLTSSGTTEIQHFGVADHKGRQWSMTSRNKPASASSAVERGWSTLYCYSTTQGDGSGYGLYASWGSVTHDGFAVHVNTLGGDRRVHWLAIGGSGVSANVGSFDMSTSAGTQAVTGVGFTPSLVMFSAGTDSVTEGYLNNAARFGLGAMTASDQWCMTTFGTGPVNPSDEQGVARTDAALVRIGNTLTTSMLASRSSLDADGFTITKSTAPGAAVRCGYAALAGADLRVALTSFDQPAATGAQSITGIGFEPKAELFVSAGRVANTTATAGSRALIGAAMSSSNRRVHWGGSADAVTPTQTGRAINEAAAILHATPGAGTPTTNALADFVSQDADGFTVNWTTADATARQNLVLAFGSPDAPADTTAPTLTGSITAVLVSTTSYTLTCPLATDDVAVTGYQYQLNAEGWVTISAEARSVTVTGRTPGATDSVQMRAFDAIPNYSTALSASVTLAADVVDPPVVTPPATGSLPIKLGLTSAGALVIWA